MRNLLVILIFIPSITMADSSLPIRERIKWADENKCTISIDREMFPFIPFLAATYNEKGVNNIKVKEKISSAVARGCDVNSIDQAGLSALNVGILFDQPDIVKLMLSLGANPKLTIKSESGQLSGLDSLGFVEKLSSLKKPRKEIEALIRQKV